jgi:hypothetical protein
MFIRRGALRLVPVKSVSHLVKPGARVGPCASHQFERKQALPSNLSQGRPRRVIRTAARLQHLLSSAYSLLE